VIILVYKTYKFKLYPNKQQEILIQKTFGCTRFIYNYFLAKRIELYKINKCSISYNQMSKELTKLKKELEWLREPDKWALQNSLKNLDSAYQNFFREIKKGNKNQRFPKFKSKKNNYHSYRTSYCMRSNGYPNIVIKGNKIKLPKLSWIKFKKSQEVYGKIINCIINQVPSGKYFISICCEVEINQLPQTKYNIGIDLGIKNFAIFSDGIKINNPKHLQKLEKRLKKEQNKLNKKKVGSKNRNKQRIKFVKIHEKIHNQRQDFLHKLSSKIINENQIICLEDLKLQTMLCNNKNINKNISNNGLYEFRRQLEYKGKWYGRNIIIINQYFPSSQLCSDCGFKNEKVKDLNIREWQCLNCGEIHDRDINAAKNILNEGLKQVI
jgi:putative transposase